MKYTIEIDDSKMSAYVQSELDCTIKTLGRRVSANYYAMGNKFAELVNELEVDDIKISIRKGGSQPVMIFPIGHKVDHQIIEDIINKVNCQWRALLIQFVNLRSMLLLHAELTDLPKPDEQAPF